MAIEKLIVFKGPNSMTGLATRDKFPGLEFVAGEDFLLTLKALTAEQSIAILPIWNSHVGEIPKTEILDYIFERNLLVHSIWPVWIKFPCITKTGTKETEIKKIASIGLVKHQCSDFIREMGATLISSKSTIEAYEKFTNDTNLDAALCSREAAKKNCDSGIHEVFADDVANELNFTTFVLLGKDKDNEWTGDKWIPLNDVAKPKECHISCVVMPTLTGSLSEEQQDMFDLLSEDCTDINEIPKIIFAASRVGEEGAKIILLLEDKRQSERPGFPDIGLVSDVKILNNAGSTKSLYAEEVKVLIKGKYNDFINKPFVKHTGDNTSFYACPPLDIMIHGYDSEVVEPIIRQTIGQHFEAYVKGEMDYSEEQGVFFDNYKNAYLDDGLRFPTFVSFP